LDDPPVISIVTPSLNQVEFVDQTIRSVLTQRYPRLEYIVQDGGSTDGTLKVLDAYRASLHHCEVGADGGQAQAINLGFTHATGEVMAYLNSDDLILPGALAYVARYFQRHPEVDVVYGHRVLVDEDDKEVGRWIVPRHRDEALSWADYVPQETLYWRRRLWEENEIELNEESQFALDWDLMLQFRDAGARIVRVPRFLGAFRVHSAQKSSADIHTAGAREMAKIRERVHGRRVTQDEIRRNIRGYMRRHVVLDRLYRARLLRY
jgi:glycosyltransferase involved in cell wall biosynthesis